MGIMLSYTYTLGPAYNEFRYKEDPGITYKFLCIKIIDWNVKQFGYNDQFPEKPVLYIPDNWHWPGS